MNLNAGLNNLLNKEKNIKKEILNKNITKIVNLILSNQSMVTSNLKLQRNLINRMSLYKKGYSMKNKNTKKKKISSVYFKERFSSRDLSIINIKNKNNININIPNISFKNIQKRNNYSFYILKKHKNNNNLNTNDIPNNNISYQKSKIDLVSQYKTESISKTKKAKSFSSSRNSSYSMRVWDEKKAAKRDFSSNEQQKNKNKKRINWTSNKPIKQNNFYLIKKQIHLNDNLRAKINHYVEKLKKKSQREISKGKYYSFLIRNSIHKKKDDKIFSYESFKKRKKIDKNLTFGNITTNNSDKEYTNLSTKKNNNNNITTNSNNIHCYTTNFNNSTNITETNDDIIIKKNTKKKVGLPFHPNSRKEFVQIQNDSKKYLIRNNKSEIYIPYNKKKTFPKIKREISGYNLKLLNQKMKNHNEKMKITNTAREKDKNYINLYENKNFITCFEDLNMNFNSISSNNKNLFRNKAINDMGKEKNKIKSKIKNETIEFSEGIEMNHFRIVAIIQENKKLLKESENYI